MCIRMKQKKGGTDRKKVTLSLNSKIYTQFQEFCKENDIMLSKRVDKLIKKHLEENKR